MKLKKASKGIGSIDPAFSSRDAFDDGTAREHRMGGLRRLAGWGVVVTVLMLVAVSLGNGSPQSGPRRIRVVLDRAYPPYSFLSDTGKLQGILVDQWQEWEKKTGIEVEIHALDWAEAVARMRAGEFDVIGCIVETTERQAYFDFSPPLGKMEVPIFFRREISGIADIPSLIGLPVGVKAGDQLIDKLKAQGVTTLIPFPNHNAIVEAAKQRKIGVFLLDAAPAFYLLTKAGIENDFRQSAPVYREELRRAVRKGDTAMLQMVTEGFAAIGPEELRRIDEKWFGRTINKHGRYLTYAGYASGLAVVFILGLVGWNRTLRKAILQRTTELSESELRLRQITENSREVFWMATVAMDDVLYVSPAYENVWGRPLESLRQRPASFLEAIYAEDRPEAIKALTSQREAGFDIEYRIVRPDGSIRWIRDRGFPIKDASGRVYRIAGISDDITDRKLAIEAVKQADDRVRVVIDTIPTMAWSVRPDGRVDFLNERWSEYTGLALEDCVKDPTAPVHPDDIPKVIENWKVHMAVGRSYEDEMRLRRADGAYRWFLVRTVPLRDECGNIVKWVGSSIDIEDRKQAEQMVRDSREQLRALTARLESLREKERIEIAREIHDDLGQKLTALKMDLRRAERKMEALEASPEMNALLEALLNASELVDGIIASVQEIAGNLRPEMLDKLGLSAALRYEARRFQERTGILCETRFPETELDLSREGATALFRIFQECLTNVARHAKATRVEATLKTELEAVSLCVHDNGRGITQAEIANPGSLGLLGMTERTALQGGGITFQGDPATGTTVTVRIRANGVSNPVQEAM